MKFFKFLVLSLSLIFVLSGCGGESSNGAGGALSISVQADESEIEMNSQNMKVTVNVYDSNNTPYQTGSVRAIYPDDIKTGRDVGHFSSSSVPLNDGTAIFSYTGPGNIVDNSSDIVFKFYHEDNPTLIKDYTMKIDTSKAILTGY